MAIYRSDQAQVSFGVESTAGAFPENATVTGAVAIGTGGASRTISGGTAVGATSITLSDNSDLAALENKDEEWFAVIGGDTPAHGPKEVRKVMTGSFTGAVLTLDHPLAFAHGAGAPVLGYIIIAGTAPPVVSSATHVPNYLSWLPGVYDAVDVPDPEQAFEPYYILGSQNRNFYSAYPGQESLNGSIGGMVLLNATPLRFALGKITTRASDVDTTATKTWAIHTAAPKGATMIIIKNTNGSPANMTSGTYLAIGGEAGSDASGHSLDSTEENEIRQMISTTITNPTTDAAVHITLASPLQFAHAVDTPVREASTGSSNEFYHTIWETNALDSITMNVNVMDSSETSANTWQRRYVGGKVGGMTMSAEEGGLLNVGWDSMMFTDMMHNMQRHPDLSNSGPKAKAFMPRYGAMVDIGSTNIGKPTSTSSTTPIYVRPSTSPYYFSHGEVRMYGVDPSAGGQVLGRLRSFSITIGNSEEPRYYITRQREGKRGPTEILEQRREYSMSATIATEDSSDVTTSDRNVFKELLLAGDYRGTTGLTGFAIELTFTRGTNDIIQIRIPGENFDSNANVTASAAGAATAQGGEQGAFIRSAAHNIGDSNPLEAEVDILFRSMIINITDNEPVYP